MLFGLFSFYALSGPVYALVRLWQGKKQDETEAKPAAIARPQVRPLDSDEESSLEGEVMTLLTLGLSLGLSGLLLGLLLSPPLGGSERSA